MVTTQLAYSIPTLQDGPAKIIKIKRSSKRLATQVTWVRAWAGIGTQLGEVLRPQHTSTTTLLFLSFPQKKVAGCIFVRGMRRSLRIM